VRYFPLFLDLKGRRVVVVGGGAVAARKVELLAGTGATLVIVAPAVTPALAARIEAGEARHAARAFEPADLEGARLAIAATDSPFTNRAVAIAAEARGILVNVVDDAALSSGIVPAIVDRSPLLVAVSSEGTAPALARLVRERIEIAIDESFGRLARFTALWRQRIKAALPDVSARRRFYDWLLRGPVAGLVRRARDAEASAQVARALDEGLTAPAGSVTLVGAGPGDPGLLTLNALRALQSADVVLHDRLVSPEVLALARRDADLITVGKGGSGHSVRQDEIHDLMVEHAHRGRRVVRLKGGDPFVFGRGGEELQHLVANGIDFEVVPGITAALACGAYAGIPLTHRDHSGAVRFVTAHCRESLERTDWQGLARGEETLAVYMGVATLGVLAGELIRHGRPASTPIAFIENGSRPEQRVLTGTLGEAVALAAAHGLKAPALLVVGAVASLAHDLHWFGAEPVSGAPAAKTDAARSAA